MEPTVLQPQRKGWWARNWKWFVPVGCLTSLAVVVGVIVLFISLVFGVMKSSDAYKQAMVAVRANQQVVANLGTPIEEGTFVSGNVSVTNGSGQAELAIPVSGPHGTGTVYVQATKSAGQWTFDELVVEIDETQHRIDLLENAAP